MGCKKNEIHLPHDEIPQPPPSSGEGLNQKIDLPIHSCPNVLESGANSGILLAPNRG